MLEKLKGKTLIVKEPLSLYELRQFYNKPTLRQRIRKWFNPKYKIYTVKFKLIIRKNKHG